MEQIKQRRQNVVSIRYQTDALGRVLGYVPQRYNDIFAQRRTGQVTGGQKTSSRVCLNNNNICLKYDHNITVLSNYLYYYYVKKKLII